MEQAGAFTVAEFCASHKISRSALYQLWREGDGPRFFKIGVVVRISKAAAAAWVAESEAAATAAAHKAAEQEVAEVA